MAERFVVNPFLRCQPYAGDDPRFLTFAPKPGEGLKTLAISRSGHADLFDIFSELAPAKLKFLDTENDLTRDERDLLCLHGVLVESESQPVKPLFSCDLNDVDEFEGELDLDGLIINPSFRFEPFDLKKFTSWAQSKSLSPYRPSVWIKTPITGIECGYWIADEQAEIIAKFSGGKPVPTGLDERLARKLVTPNVISTADSLEARSSDRLRSLEEARNKFALDKYAVLKNILPPEQVTAVGAYYRQYVDQGFMTFGDSRVERRYIEHNEPLASFFHSQLSKLMSIIVGEPVKPSYVYAVSYVEGSVLPPHTDREQCEYSISLQVDYQPKTPDNVSPWAIYLEPLNYPDKLPEIGFQFELEQLESSRTCPRPDPIRLTNGDGLIYKGRELIHYRHVLPQGHRSTSLFFHFVTEDFAGELI